MFWQAENIYRGHTGSYYCYHIGGRQTYDMWRDNNGIWNTRIILSPCFNWGVKEPSPWQCKTSYHTNYTECFHRLQVTNNASPCLQFWYLSWIQTVPKAERATAWPRFQSLETMNVDVTQHMRQLNSSGQWYTQITRALGSCHKVWNGLQWRFLM